MIKLEHFSVFSRKGYCVTKWYVRHFPHEHRRGAPDTPQVVGDPRILRGEPPFSFAVLTFFPSTQSQKTVTIVGAGKLGSLIVDELLKRGAAVRVLARTPGKIAAKPGVDVVAFDALTATDGEVEAALRNSWAVVSSLQGGREVIINAQTKLVHAARKVGARRFISSTFSCNIFTAWPGDNINTDIRRQFADSVDALHADGQFEVVHVSNGVFVDAGGTRE